RRGGGTGGRAVRRRGAGGRRGAARRALSPLSGGMARRVARARAIALDPPLIMYDEPFTGLDPVGVATIARLIRRLNDAVECASIVVSHDIEDTFAIADYVYLLAGGRVAASGTPDEMRASADPNVRQFLEARIDGPVAFHYHAKPLAADLGLPACAHACNDPRAAAALPLAARVRPGHRLRRHDAAAPGR